MCLFKAGGDGLASIRDMPTWRLSLHSKDGRLTVRLGCQHCGHALDGDVRGHVARVIKIEVGDVVREGQNVRELIPGQI